MQNTDFINGLPVLSVPVQFQLNEFIVKNNGNCIESSAPESLYCSAVLRTRVDYFVKLKTWFDWIVLFVSDILDGVFHQRTELLHKKGPSIQVSHTVSEEGWRHWKRQNETKRFIMMYPIDGYRYADQLVPAMFERWPDPDTNFTPNESSFYRNELERNNCKISENIYKTNEFNETKTKHNNIGYNLRPMSSYLFIPYFGGLQPNAAPPSPIVWHRTTDPNHHIGSYLSSDAIPFIPAKSGSRKCHFTY